MRCNTKPTALMCCKKAASMRQSRTEAIRLASRVLGTRNVSVRYHYVKGGIFCGQKHDTVKCLA